MSPKSAPFRLRQFYGEFSIVLRKSLFSGLPATQNPGNLRQSPLMDRSLVTRSDTQDFSVGVNGALSREGYFLESHLMAKRIGDWTWVSSAQVTLSQRFDLDIRTSRLVAGFLPELFIRNPGNPREALVQ